MTFFACDFSCIYWTSTYLFDKIANTLHLEEKIVWLERYCQLQILHACSWKSLSIDSSLLLSSRMTPGLLMNHLLHSFLKTFSNRNSTTHLFQVSGFFSFVFVGFFSLICNLNFPFCHLIFVLLWVNTEQKHS